MHLLRINSIKKVRRSRLVFRLVDGGLLAQWLEQWTVNPKVLGSSPR